MSDYNAFMQKKMATVELNKLKSYYERKLLQIKNKKSKESYNLQNRS